jgi:hypothetical protein
MLAGRSGIVSRSNKGSARQDSTGWTQMRPGVTARATVGCMAMVLSVWWRGQSCLLGTFQWMRNSGHEAKRMWLETGKLKGLMTTVLMDSKADDQAWFFELQRQRHILLLTTTRKGKDKSPKRKRMIKVLQQQKNKLVYKQRSYTVEPMQGLVKDIFELERCWMRGHENNRWLFAAMGVVVQMHQYRAWTEGRSTWAIKQEVLGR